MSQALPGTRAAKPAGQAGGGWGRGEDKAKIIRCGQGSAGDGQRAGGAHGKGTSLSMGGTRKLFRGMKLLGAPRDHLTGQGWGRGPSPVGGLQARETEEAGEARGRRELARPRSEATFRHLDFI